MPFVGEGCPTGIFQEHGFPIGTRLTQQEHAMFSVVRLPLARNRAEKVARPKSDYLLRCC